MEEYLPMARGIAKRWAARNPTLDAWELESAAMDGLMRGIDYGQSIGAKWMAGLVYQNIRWSVSKAVDRLRRIKRRERRMHEGLPARPQRDTAIWTDVRSLLNDREWSDVRARHLEGSNFREIATEEGTSPQAAQKRYHRAIDRLRETYGD